MALGALSPSIFKFFKTYSCLTALFPNLWKAKRSAEVDQASKEEVLKALGLWDDPSIARESKV